MAISALQRQQDWGTQYLDDSGEWMQNDGAVATGAAAANDEGGLSSAASDSSSNPALMSAVVSAAASVLTDGAIGAAQSTADEAAPAPTAPTETIDPPPVEMALSIDAGEEKQPPLISQTPAATPDVSATTALDPAVAPAAPPAVDSAAIATVWNTYSATEPYRIYQAMDEHGWSDADVAQATGQTEQQVGNYLTGNGVQAGFGGAATVGRDAIDAPYIAAVTAAEASPPSQPDASSPWWTLNTPAPGSAYNEAGEMVDESGTVQPTMVFNLGTFTSWYESQGTPESQAFAQMHGAFTVAAGGSLRFASGATVSFGYTEAGAITPPAMTWAMDKRITDYAGYAKGDAFTIDAMRGMVDTPQNQQIIQVFGGATAALPNNEMGERMRAMYGSDLATEMMQLTAATDAMKARYIGDMNAAISTPGAAGAGQALAPWWTLDAAPPAQYGENGLQLDESGQPIPQYTFNAAAFHAWYAAQPDPANQLIGQVYGTELASGPSGYRTTGAADSLNVQIGLDENGHATAASDTTLSNDLVRVNLADPKDMYDNGAVYFLPTQGFVTSKDNIKPETDFWDEIIPIIIVAAVSYFSAGTLGPATAVAMGLGETAATLTTAGLIVSAAVAGAATSMVSGMLNDNLSLKGILQGALAGGLTAGLTSSLSSISNLGPAAGIATRGTIQGCVQAIMGGSFKDGMVAGLASGVSDALSTNINSGVVAGLKTGTMTAAGAITARYCASMLGSAIRIVACGSGAPGYAAAQAFLDSTFQQAGAPPDMLPANNPALMGTTGQSLPAVAGDGSEAAVTTTATEPTPATEPASTQVLVDSLQSVSAVTDPSLAGTTGQVLPPAAENNGSAIPVADTPTPDSAVSDPAVSGTTGQVPPSTPEVDSAVTPATDASTPAPAAPISATADPALAGTTGQVPPVATDDDSSPAPVADTPDSPPDTAVPATADSTLAGTTGQAPPPVSVEGGDAASTTAAPTPPPMPAVVDRPLVNVSADLFGDPSPNNPGVPTGSDQQTQAQRDAETALLNAQSTLRASEIAQQNADALTQDANQQPSLPTSSPTSDDAMTQFRQSELASMEGSSVAGTGHVAQSGDNISRILGTSDPQAIGNFIRANGLTSSTLQAGRNYFVPDDTSAYGDSAALGQAVLNGDNARLQMLANQRAGQQQASWDSLRQGAWSNRTGDGPPVWHVSTPPSASSPAMVSQDVFSPMGDYMGTTAVATDNRPIASGDSIGPDQGYGASISAIGQSDLSLSDKLSMTWGTTKYYFRGSDAAQGTVQALGGAAEVAGAAGLTSTGLGTVIAVPLAFHGGDNIGSGLSRAFGRGDGTTATYQGVYAATGSAAAAGAVDQGIPFLAGVAGAGAFVNGLGVESRAIIDPTSSRYSQATIGYRSSTGYTLDDTRAYAQVGGELPRIDVVRSENGDLTSIDNRRIYVGRQVADNYYGYGLPATIRESDELLTPGEVMRFSLSPESVSALAKRGFNGFNPVPQTWGDAASLRILNQETRAAGRGFSTDNPTGSLLDPKITGKP